MVLCVGKRREEKSLIVGAHSKSNLYVAPRPLSICPVLILFRTCKAGLPARLGTDHQPLCDISFPLNNARGGTICYSTSQIFPGADFYLFFEGFNIVWSKSNQITIALNLLFEFWFGFVLTQS